MNNDLQSILVSEKEIEAITERLGMQIYNDYKDSGKKLLLLTILKGAVLFSTDLMRKINLPIEIDFMKVSSYDAGTVSSGKINIHLDLKRTDLADVDIIIVEDIIDSGKTLSFLVDYLRQKGAHSVKTCTMLDKPSRREVEFTPDYCGRQIPDAFVVGYGLDYNEQYRHLPYIGILKPEMYGE